MENKAKCVVTPTGNKEKNVNDDIADDDFTLNECGDTMWDDVLEQEEIKSQALKSATET